MRLSVEQQTAGQVDATGHHVLMRGDAEGAAEGSYEMRGVGVYQARGLFQGDAFKQTLVEEITQIPGDVAVGRRAVEDQPGAQMLAQPLADEGQTALRLELVSPVRESRVQLSDASAQHGIGEVRAVHHAAR